MTARRAQAKASFAVLCSTRKAGFHYRYFTSRISFPKRYSIEREDRTSSPRVTVDLARKYVEGRFVLSLAVLTNSCLDGPEEQQ